MAFKTIVARFSGSTCRRCNQPIAVGSKFRWGGRNNCWHLSKECPANQSAPVCSPAHAVSPVDCGDESDLEPVPAYAQGDPCRDFLSRYDEPANVQ